MGELRRGLGQARRLELLGIFHVSRVHGQGKPFDTEIERLGQQVGVCDRIDELDRQEFFAGRLRPDDQDAPGPGLGVR